MTSRYLFLEVIPFSHLSYAQVFPPSLAVLKHVQRYYRQGSGTTARTPAVLRQGERYYRQDPSGTTARDSGTTTRIPI